METPEKKSSLKDLNVDVFELIRIIIDVYQKKMSISEAATLLANKYGKQIQDYISVFSENKVQQAMKKSDSEELQKLAEGDFPQKLVSTAGVIAGIVYEYIYHQKTEIEFIEALRNSGIKQVGMDVLNIYHIDIQTLNGRFPEGISSVSTAVIAYVGFAEAYKILRKALDDEKVSCQRRIQIEKECQLSIERIEKYRKEMESAVSEYLSDKLEVIESGFRDMDQAILAGDTNGYIRGNVQIQKLLGYEVQFSSQDEFDDLMDSDMNFVL